MYSVRSCLNISQLCVNFCSVSCPHLLCQTDVCTFVTNFDFTYGGSSVVAQYWVDVLVPWMNVIAHPGLNVIDTLQVNMLAPLWLNMVAPLRVNMVAPLWVNMVCPMWVNIVGLRWADVVYVLELDMPMRSWAVIPFILEYVHGFQVGIVFCDVNGLDVLVINGISIITCAKYGDVPHRSYHPLYEFEQKQPTLCWKSENCHSLTL
jgi:hypothetical protein